MTIIFSPEALEDQRHFRKCEPKTADKIKQLVQDIMREPYAGLGKPEPLKHGLSGYWSRRIDHKNRLVYTVKDDTIYVISCRHHY